MIETATFKLTATAILALVISTGALLVQRDQARAELATFRAEVATATAKAEANARTKENELRGQAEQLRTHLAKEIDNAKTRQDRLVADIRAGTQRLSIAANCSAASQTGADSALAPGSGADSARAELDPQAAETLVTIAADGDNAIRERNACVAQYNQVRQLMAGD